jgi:hypothetical protein
VKNIGYFGFYGQNDRFKYLYILLMQYTWGINMVEPLPRWIMRRYSVLWNKFNDKEFTHKQAIEALKEKDERVVSLCISDLKKYGWIYVRINPEDSRIRLYRLKSPERAVKEMKRQ